MSKHTPGPWAIRQEKEGWCRIYAPKDYYVGGEIAHYVSNANANLIAAAPELLEFANEAIRYAGLHGDDYLADKARAVIAKTTGGNQ